MIRYICECSDEVKELHKATIKVIDGKIRTVEAVCSCGKYMQELDKEFNGFPNLIRTEPTLSNKRDKIWKRAKENLTGERNINDTF